MGENIEMASQQKSLSDLIVTLSNETSRLAKAVERLSAQLPEPLEFVLSPENNSSFDFRVKRAAQNHSSKEEVLKFVINEALKSHDADLKSHNMLMALIMKTFQNVELSDEWTQRLKDYQHQA